MSAKRLGYITVATSILTMIRDARHLPFSVSWSDDAREYGPTGGESIQGYKNVLVRVQLESLFNPSPIIWQ